MCDLCNGKQLNASPGVNGDYSIEIKLVRSEDSETAIYIYQSGLVLGYFAVSYCPVCGASMSYNDDYVSATITPRINIYKEIVDYLNQVCGTRYKASAKATQRHINARITEGFCLDDFKTVIDKKHHEWTVIKPEMKQYLRPETLFGTKFESYLNQSIPQFKSNKDQAALDTLRYEYKGDYFSE